MVDIFNALPILCMYTAINLQQTGGTESARAEGREVKKIYERTCGGVVIAGKRFTSRQEDKLTTEELERGLRGDISCIMYFRSSGLNEMKPHKRPIWSLNTASDLMWSLVLTILKHTVIFDLYYVR